MKQFLFMMLAACMLTACGSGATKTEVSEEESTTAPTPVALTAEQLKPLSFNEIFTAITAEEIPTDVFTLVAKDFTVITAGDSTNYNSMVAGWGGWGVEFNKPTTWCMLRANRYTLEYMRREQKYTFCYFDESYKPDIMQFGMKSGRDSNKMKESKLQAVTTPGGSIAYKEAKLVIECRLVQITTVSPDDFYTEEGRKFVTDAYAEAKEWHKMVFGEITGVWKR
ncbi:MAG: flavin reductase [Mediterranea sp.]|jgi:flavin reductase (DIM6/NTAB) family NADH-FMN oxidoreductase RutF|nr:flavin reductase [Mediterranea sp.]